MKSQGQITHTGIYIKERLHPNEDPHRATIAALSMVEANRDKNREMREPVIQLSHGYFENGIYYDETSLTVYAEYLS